MSCLECGNFDTRWICDKCANKYIKLWEKESAKNEGVYIDKERADCEAQRQEHIRSVVPTVREGFQTRVSALGTTAQPSNSGSRISELEAYGSDCRNGSCEN